MKVAFRVDASREIGSGHFMRCLSLADALHRRGAGIRFLSGALPDHMGDLLRRRTYRAVPLHAPVTDAVECAGILEAEGCDWLVVDHYALGAQWERALRPFATRILVIDDLADRDHDCDVLLDQNLQSDPIGRYAGRVPEHCQLLLGPRYALLRDEFARARHQVQPRSGAVARLLVAFGGADTGNWTRMAIDAVVEAGVKAHVDVVIGAEHPERAAIEAACVRHGFSCHVQTTNMAALLARADLAIGAGGISAWERCCLGVPAIVRSVAANQDAQVAEAAIRGLLYDGGGARGAAPLAVHLTALAANPHLRFLISRNGMEAVDGRGTERVARLLDAPRVHVREAVAGDADALFTWRNDETVRAMSHGSAPIARSDHDAWLRAVLADPDRLLLIAERDGVAEGVVRFDLRATPATVTATVSMYRVPGSAHRGLGPSLLLAAEAWLRVRRPDVTRLSAEVLGDNERSHRLFQSAGYHPRSSTYDKRVQA